MRAARVALLGCIVSLPCNAYGWDTNINSNDDWKSIYETEQARFCATASYHPNDEGQPDDLSTHGGGNEHAEIADDTLWVISPDLRNKLGIDGAYGLSADEPWLFIDLNATYRRHFDFEDAEVMRDDPATVLEERAMGDLVRYAGISDFNYTIYDWINKSVICPAIPPNLTGVEKAKVRYDLCHLYTMWKGAGLNASHFGSLATKMWIRHHAIAMGLAEEAKALREDFGESGMAFHEDVVKEAELMALIYEMAGQHFLQDRWSTGHMFSRWGAGGFEDLPRDRQTGEINLDAVLAAAMFSGIVHGSEAVFGFPDPVSSPLIDEEIGDDKIVEAGWSYSEDNRAFQSSVNHTGVGDYRFGDLVDQKYDGQLVCSRRSAQEKKPLVEPEAQLTSRNQSKGLRYCTSMALRRVIAAFGATEGDRYGALDIELKEPTSLQQTLILPNPSDGKEGLDLTQPGTEDYKLCHDMWLDNATFYLGYKTIFGTGKLHIGRDLWITAKHLINASGDDGGPSKPAVRVTAQHTLLRWNAHRHKTADEREAKRRGQSQVVYGTETAKNGYTLGFGPRSGLGWVSVKPNNNYGVPAYMEPEDLDTLPLDQDVEDDDGRTAWAVHGFFNRAKARYWCQEVEDRKDALTDFLDEIRDSTEHVRDEPRQKELATCAFLATRLYKRTDDRYLETGSRFERIGDHMPFGAEEKYGEEFEPVCSYLDPTLTKAYDGEQGIYQIHPGYVEEPGREAMWDIGAPDGEKRGLAPQTLKNWCDKIPVIDFTYDDPMYPDKVAEVGRDPSNGFRWAILTGANYGLETLSMVQGTIEATEAGTTNWIGLNIYDDRDESFSGGWSRDKRSVSPQIPGSMGGFPSVARDLGVDPMQAPHAVKYAGPRVYHMALTQPNDPDADVELFGAEGKRTVGTYELLVYPTFEESAADFSGGIEKKAFYATWPEWVRPTSEVLAKGLYIVTPDPDNPGQDIYTPVTSAPIIAETDAGRYEFDVNGDAQLIPNPDEIGILLESPGGFPPELTNNTIAWVFAFH